MHGLCARSLRVQVHGGILPVMNGRPMRAAPKNERGRAMRASNGVGKVLVILGDNFLWACVAGLAVLMAIVSRAGA